MFPELVEFYAETKRPNELRVCIDAGSFLMFLSTLTVVGVLISDLLLAWLDPRIRLMGGSTK